MTVVQSRVVGQVPCSPDVSRVHQSSSSTCPTGCLTDESFNSSATNSKDDRVSISGSNILKDLSFDCFSFEDSNLIDFDVSTARLKRKRSKKSSASIRAKLPPGVEDIDSSDDDDGNGFDRDYGRDSACWWRFLEVMSKYRVTPESILRLQDPQVIGVSHRTLLVDWLAHRAFELSLFDETLHTSVSLLDRGLSKIEILDSVDGEVLAGACLHLAVKLEETSSIPLSQLREGLHNCAVTSRIIEMEANLVDCLDFSLQAPLIVHYLPRYLKVFGESKKSRVGQIAYYLADLSLASIKSSRYLPSELAVGCVCVALALMQKEFHTKTLQFECGGLERCYVLRIMRFISLLHGVGCEHYPLKGIYCRHYTVETNFAASVFALPLSKLEEMKS